MTDTKSPIKESRHLAALKAALMAEQQILQLDTHIARARTDALLEEAPLALKNKWHSNKLVQHRSPRRPVV